MASAFKCDTCGQYRDGRPNQLPTERTRPFEHFEWATGINVKITFGIACAPIEMCDDCLQRLQKETIDRIHEAQS